MFLSAMLRSVSLAIENRTRSIFVTRLPWTVGKKELKGYFSRFGPVRVTSIVYDRDTGISRGYGFVDFGTADGFNAAIEHDRHILDGRVISVAPSSYQSPRRQSKYSNDSDEAVAAPE